MSDDRCGKRFLRPLSDLLKLSHVADPVPPRPLLPSSQHAILFGVRSGLALGLALCDFFAAFRPGQIGPYERNKPNLFP